MHITVITQFPDLIAAHMSMSIMKRAQEKGSVIYSIVDPHDFAIDSYKTVDDRPYGGGAGMLMRVDIAHKALLSIKNPGRKILVSPRGRQYSQEDARRISKEESITIIAPHYEGIDVRIEEYVDEVISIGDYVITSGTLASAILIDSIVRLIPGVLKKEEATVDESFSTPALLEYPQYTRPEEYEGKKVPEILLSGDHKKIKEWKKSESIKMTPIQNE